MIGRVKVMFDAELCVVYVNTKTCFLIPYSLILCFSDMCAAWFSVTSYAALHYDNYPGYSLLKEVTSCLNNLRELLAQHYQKAYFLLKMWPSLVIGSILRDLESSAEFIDTITHDLSPMLKSTSFYMAAVSPVTDLTHAMLKLELAGLWKTMGHPIVNMDKSTKS